MMPFFARRRVLLLAEAIRVIVSRDSETFSRDSTATVTDFEGLFKEVKPHEMRFDGWRRVENLLSSSDLSTWTAGNSGEIVGDVCNFVNSNSYFSWYGAGFASEKFIVSFTASTAINQAVFFDIVDNADGSDSHGVTLNITTVPKRYTFVGDMSSSTTFSGSMGFYINRGHTLPAGTLLTMTDIQIEAGTGQANQNPSEFVSTGLATSKIDILFGTDSDMSGANNWHSLGLGVVDVNTTVAGKLYALGNGGDEYVRLFSVFAVGKTYDVSFTAYIHTGADTSLRVGHNFGSVGNGNFDIDATSVSQFFEGTLTADGSNVNLHIGTISGGDLNGIAFVIDDVQITEHIMKHEANVDGVKYFDYENGNTVVGDIVTEAQGVALNDNILEGIHIEDVNGGTLADELSISYASIPQSFSLEFLKFEPDVNGNLLENTYIFTTVGTGKIRVKIGTIDSITMLNGGVDIVIASTNFTANVRMNLIVDIVQQGTNVNVKIKDGVTPLLNETTVGTLAHSDLNEIYIGSNGGTDGFTFATFGSLDDITLYDLT